MKKLLLVEDDVSLARVLRDNFEFEGFDVTWVVDARQALGQARELSPDLIVLDVMLPGEVDGFDLCHVLRRSGGSAPIIMLTAKNEKADKLRGLSLGADDYVTKPFDLEELLARVNAVLRRARSNITRLSLGDIEIDFRTQSVTKAGKRLHLTQRELDLLHYLAERQTQVVFRDELLRGVWGYLDLPSTRSVDHAIARLRKKIEPDVHHPRFIHTVHGDGYCLRPEASQATSERR